MLSQFEIDALLGAAGREDDAGSPFTPAAGSAVVTGRSVKTYDFRRPDKFSKDQLRTLQAIHENVARLAAARLSARLRTSITMSLADTSQMIYDGFTAGLNLPTQLIVLSVSGLGGPVLVDLDLGLAQAAVERLLGGPGRIPPTRREPTTIEAPLIERVVGDLVGAIAEGWSHLQALEARVDEMALGPDLLRVAAPSHVVAVLTLEVRIAGQSAPLTICYPHDTLAPVLPRLSATAWYSQRDQGGERMAGRAELTAALQRVQIPVAAVLGGVELSVEALVDLQPGNVIRFEERTTAPLRLSVMDQANAWVLPGRVGDRVAVRLISPLAPMEA